MHCDSSASALPQTTNAATTQQTKLPQTTTKTTKDDNTTPANNTQAKPTITTHDESTRAQRLRRSRRRKPPNLLLKKCFPYNGFGPSGGYIRTPLDGPRGCVINVVGHRHTTFLPHLDPKENVSFPAKRTRPVVERLSLKRRRGFSLTIRWPVLLPKRAQGLLPLQPSYMTTWYREQWH